jgi:hypothetical protein
VSQTAIDDLARPRLPLAIRTLNAVGDAAARRLVRLDAASLEAAARRRTGLEDLGDPGYREPLALLLDSLEREAGLSALGRALTRAHLIQLLASRLRLEALIRRHPEIERERIERPIVIAGLPRTGTTHLFNLLAQDAGLRWLPYWESLEPIPAPNEPLAADGRDPRIGRAERGLDFLYRLMPLFPAMHEMTPEGPHEEIQLLALAFSTQLFEASYFVPSYGAWYRDTDQRPAYAYLRRVLQALQWLRRGERWLLKSPQHLENLGALAETFPDAVFLQTHRDPVRIVASLATMIAYGARMQHRRPDPFAVGRHWAGRVEDMLRASVRDRGKLPAAQVTDVRFDDLMRDPLGVAARALAFAGRPPNARTEAALRGFLAANPKGKHGAVAYRLAPLGLEEAPLRARLRFYAERFDVSEEGDAA